MKTYTRTLDAHSARHAANGCPESCEACTLPGCKDCNCGSGRMVFACSECCGVEEEEEVLD